MFLCINIFVWIKNIWTVCAAKVFSHPQTAARSCRRPPWSSLWRPDHEDTTPTRCHHRCRCAQAGRSGEPQVRHTKLYIHPHPTNTDTNNLCLRPELHRLTSANPGNGWGMSAVRACPCLCSCYLSKTPLIWWLMTVCVTPSALSPLSPQPIHPFPPLSIFSQQQIFIWWFTPGLCSPECQQPRSFSAASQWFPGCTRPHFPPVEAAKQLDHTLSSVQGTTSGYRTGAIQC